MVKYNWIKIPLPVINLFFLGFSAGIPILLIFSSLGLWLREAGIERSAVTLFSWAALGYSFKFVWAPLVDQLPIPYLTKWLGQRRSWILLAQCLIIISIIMMAMTNPVNNEYSLTIMALAAVLLGFSSATQDIVIDAYRIESAKSELQALMSASYIAGYRVAMLVSGAGALYLAHYFGSTKAHYNYQAWQYTYLIMALVMLIGIITTLIIKEPKSKVNKKRKKAAAIYLGFLVLFIFAILAFITTFYLTSDWHLVIKRIFSSPYIATFITGILRLSSAIFMAYLVAKGVIFLGIAKKSMLDETYFNPIKDFFNRYGLQLALLLLTLIGLYRISDIVLGVISNVFYQDLGFTKPEIATVVKTFGLLMSIAGGFLGGLLSLRYGVIKILFVGALLSALTNLLFMLLAQAGHNLPLLYFVISADNLSAGLASAAFVAFLSQLTNISFTAIQYAIFSSLMTLLPKILGGYSGTLVDTFGYSQFFLFTTLLGFPVLFLIAIVEKQFKLN